MFKKTLFAAVLSVLCSLGPLDGSAQERTPEPELTVKVLVKKLKGAPAGERTNLLDQLRKIESEESSRALLKILKENLSHRRGYETVPSVSESGGMTLWMSTVSENSWLVDVLYARSYMKALPAFQKMIKLDERWGGKSKYVLAEYIYKLTGKPSRFKIGASEVTFPEP